jgi:ABC-type molybdate transport system substrate-binding protein
MKTATLLVILALGLGTAANAAEIPVLSTGGARAVMTSLVPEYERISGDKVTISFATPGQMPDKARSG